MKLLLLFILICPSALGAAGSFYMIPDASLSPIGTWFQVGMTVDSGVTGDDYQLLSHGTPIQPLSQSIGNSLFSDVLRMDLKSDLGASIQDVSKPLPAGTYSLASYQFAAGIDQVTVYGSFVGTAPLFLDTTLTPVTLDIPEPVFDWKATLIVWIGLIIAYHLGRRRQKD